MEYGFKVRGQRGKVKEPVLHHFDLYRLESLDDFIQAGFDEYLYQPGTKVFVEWPEIVAPLLTKDACFVSLDYVDAQTRQMAVCAVD